MYGSTLKRSLVERLHTMPLPPRQDSGQTYIAYWLGSCPTYDEFIRHVNRAKKNKADGPNGVKAEMIQLLDDDNLALAYNFIRKFWTAPDFDMEEWHNVKLALIAKTTNCQKSKRFPPHLPSGYPIQDLQLPDRRTDQRTHVEGRTPRTSRIHQRERLH